MSKKKLSFLVLILVSMIWGLGFTFSATAIRCFTPIQVLALRFTLALVILLIVYNKRLREITKYDLKLGGLVGLFMFLGFLFQTIGLQYTTATNSAFLTSVDMLTIPFLTLFIDGKKISKKEWVGTVIAFIGIFLLSWSGSLSSINKGDVLTIICGIFFGTQIYVTSKVIHKTERWKMLIGQMLVASVLSWVLLLFTGDLTFNFTKETVVSILYLGAISTLLAYYLQAWAQKYTGSTQTAVIVSLKSVFGMIGSALILKEQITLQMIVGAILMLSGAILVQVE